nr:malectin domain-containing carbohydrate-binding protein [Bacteroidota bacterium]
MKTETLLVKLYKNLHFIFFILFTPIFSNAQNWEKLAESSHPRVEALNALVDGKIYIFSGFTEFDGTILKISSKTEVFDPALLGSDVSPWKIVKDMPIAVTHTGTAVVDKNIWITGGFAGNSPGAAIKTVQIYNSQNDTWSYGPELPEEMASHAIVKCGNFLHVFGGLKPDRQSNNKVHYVLDLENQQKGWKGLANLPFPRNHLSGAAIAGKIYAIGGQYGHDEEWQDLHFVHEYDPLTDKWSRKADLPLARSHFEPGTIVIDGKIIIVGGRNENDRKILPNITQYDPAKNKWEELPPLPQNLLAPVAKIINNNFYVTHGGMYWDMPLKSAFKRSYISQSSDNLGFSPTNIEHTLDKGTSVVFKSIIWTLNNNLKYAIKKESFPDWIKISASDAANIVDPTGKFIHITLDATDLKPGTYKYNLLAEAEDLPLAVLPITLNVPDPNIIRINAGGEALVAGGIAFQKDIYFTKSKAFSNKKIPEIKNTHLDEIYISERSLEPGDNSFSYNIPVGNGRYQVRLHFAEIYWGAIGGETGALIKRVFDVNIEGGPAELKNYDIYKEVGAMAASIMDFDIVVRDGALNIDFVSKVDQPKISAIEVIPLDKPVPTLSFEKKYDSLILNHGKSIILKNTVTASDNLISKIFFTATSPEGKTIPWISINDTSIENYESLSGTIQNFVIETTKIEPGIYISEIFANANYAEGATYKIFLEVLPGETAGPSKIEVDKNKLFFSSIKENPSGIETVTIKNLGASSLLVEPRILDDANKAFKVINSNEEILEIAPNEAITLKIQYISLYSGITKSLLVLKSNDPESELISIDLYGLSSEGQDESQEPSLKEIVQALGFNVDIGFSGQYSDQQIYPIGDEILLQSFIKANEGPVKLELVARYSPAEAITFGYFPVSTSDTYLELGSLSKDQNNTLYPKFELEELLFEPFNSLFGLY